ncbi:MAG TPA: NrfD/PsrC family molybdoenzyme membrane anchor subunit [Acidimicrobiales bacterium]|nr:NrfD/PsrC family molybdoenzyme membrane anchor subunit [Acidimicrobiales bacterium]
MTRDYYGRPVLKEPVWKWYIPAYFFTGGLAGASSTLALAARASGNRPLARSALLASSAGIAVSGPLLVVDLGRPARFLGMLRVAKPTSPMSVGSWLLAVFGPASAIAAATDVSGRMGRVGWAAAAVAGVLGPAVSTYTAVLVADTAIPAWHDAYRELPFLFAGSSAASAGGVALALTPVGDAAPARRLAVVGALAELAAARSMESRVAGPYENGQAGRLARAAEACTAAGAVAALAAGRRRGVAVGAGALLAAGSMLTRFSVFRAGFESAADPAATIGPQRARLEAVPGDEPVRRRQADERVRGVPSAHERRI